MKWKYIRTGILPLGLMLVYLGGRAQNMPFDSATLSPGAFINIVKAYHPVVKQADIGVLKAGAAITMARGGFDPYAYLNSSQKTFDGTNYYLYTNPELKIPTWYGIEVKAGLENNGGQYLTQESTDGKTSYVGISVPLAKNLLMDNRRATLQQAKLFRQESERERANTINDLLFNAYDEYWNWVKEYQVYQVLTNAVDINLQRYRLVQIGFRQGDRPSIDTVEALAQIQNFQFLQSEALVRFQNAGVALSAFLWINDTTWYQLPDRIVPDSLWNKVAIPSLPIGLRDDFIYAARLNHPKLAVFNFKLQGLEVERKLKFQSLLPLVNVRANVLSKGYGLVKGMNAAYLENNNKFGIEMALPLRLSEGRGAYRMARLKISETNFERNLRMQEIENKVTAYYNELTGLQQQVNIYEQAYQNYLTLFRGETTRFNAGESTLFLLNTRENKVLETQQKLAELKTKFFKTQAAVQWAAGQLQ